MDTWMCYLQEPAWRLPEGAAREDGVEAMASRMPLRDRKTDWWVIPRVLCLLLSSAATIVIVLKLIALLG